MTVSGSSYSCTCVEVERDVPSAVVPAELSHLARPQPVPSVTDLRDTRLAKNLTLNTAAAALGTYATQISRIERARQRDDDFAARYRTWLEAA